MRWCLGLNWVSGQLCALRHDTRQVHRASGIMVARMTWCSRVWLLIHHARYVASRQVACMRLGVYMRGILCCGVK